MDFLLTFISLLWGDAVEASLAQNERLRIWRGMRGGDRDTKQVETGKGQQGEPWQ